MQCNSAAGVVLSDLVVDRSEAGKFYPRQQNFVAIGGKRAGLSCAIIDDF
jgi:hypothetical protein